VRERRVQYNYFAGVPSVTELTFYASGGFDLSCGVVLCGPRVLTLAWGETGREGEG
jgi:hypothetical protein